MDSALFCDDPRYLDDQPIEPKDIADVGKFARTETTGQRCALFAKEKPEIVKNLA